MVRPGRDLSVVALGPDAPAAHTTPPVTDVSLQPQDVYRRAMRMLFRLLDRHGAAPVAPVELLTPRRTRRETTRCGCRVPASKRSTDPDQEGRTWTRSA